MPRSSSDRGQAERAALLASSCPAQLDQDRVVPAFKPPFDIIHRIAQETKKAAAWPTACPVLLPRRLERATGRLTRLFTPLIEDTVRLSFFRCRCPTGIGRHRSTSPICNLALVAFAASYLPTCPGIMLAVR